jgi:hypothetical protein
MEGKRMSLRKPRAGAMTAVLMAVACGGGESVSDSASGDWTVDQRSWNLGAIAAFSEMVEYGVKRLALGAPLLPAEMDALYEAATEIAQSHGVGLYRESDFLVTDLFSASLTEGKEVLLICNEDTYEEYQALKAEKRRLEAQGEYVGEARTEIARRFGRLLSYPEAHIEAELTR